MLGLSCTNPPSLNKNMECVMLIYNNLIINGNSDRYQPFLLNIITGRRRLLQGNELGILKRMMHGDKSDDEAVKLFEKLMHEKQFYTDEMRKAIEESLTDSGHWKRDLYAEDYRFSIELTRACNMNCSFCYAAKRGKAPTMTKEHIDSIYSFYEKYADSHKKIEDTPFIRVTGGEPLLNEKTVELIPHIAEKWPNAKFDIFTNAENLPKYYEWLPLNKLNTIMVPGN